MPAQQIRIRLALHGYKNNPFFHIVAIANHKARNALPLEKLGEYDPIPRFKSIAQLPSESKVFGKPPPESAKSKRIEWNVTRIKWWLDKGAQPTESVVKLLEMGGVLKPPHAWTRGARTLEGSSGGSISTSGSSSDRIAGTGLVNTPAGQMTGHAGVTAT